MNSSFTTNYIKDLAPSSSLVISTPPQSQSRPTQQKDDLQSLLLQLNQPLTRSETRSVLHTLDAIEHGDSDSQDSTGHEEDYYTLRRAVIHNVVVKLYAEALDTYLAEAGKLEAEAEWWADIERSGRNVAYYFLQCECR